MNDDDAPQTIVLGPTPHGGSAGILGFAPKSLMPSASEVSHGGWDTAGKAGKLPARSAVLVVDLLALGLDAGRARAVVGGRRRGGGVVAVAGAAGIGRAVALLAGGEAAGNEDEGDQGDLVHGGLLRGVPR